MIVLAHRGLTGPDRPENTVAACTAALRAGAEGFEVDLRLSRDGVLVVSHDPDLARLTGTPMAVAEHDWTTLQAHCAAAGLQLARVEQVLDTGRPARVVLEAKQPPPGPGAIRRTATALCEQLERHAAAAGGVHVTVSSFSPALLRDVRRLLPPGSGVRTALLGRPLVRVSSLLRQALAEGHEEVHPHVLSLLATTDAVGTAHAVGVAVVPWTANRPRELRRLAALGVDGVITDTPVAARRLLAGAAARP